MLVKGLAASAEAFEALKPRSVTGTQTPAPLFLLRLSGGLSGAAAGGALGLLVWWVGRCLAETERERESEGEKRGVLH